jgi:uncharacterized protein (TIGR00369 family)
MTEIEKLIQDSFAAQGLMSTLGAELAHVASGEVHIALRPHAGLTQQHGYTHAGAITSIADSACGYAALTLAPAGHEVLTVEFKVNFMRPARAERFLAIGRVVKPGKQIMVCQGEVVGEMSSQQKAIALMQATFTSAPADT